MHLEKLGIYSEERKKELSELKRIERINIEDNRLNDSLDFYRKHRDYRITPEIVSENILEIITNRVNRKMADIKVSEEFSIGSIGSERLTNKVKLIDDISELLSNPNNASKYESDSNAVNSINSLIKEIYKDSQYICTLSKVDLNMLMKLFSNKNNPIIENLNTNSLNYTIPFLIDVITNEKNKYKDEYNNESEYSKKDSLINESLPKSVRNYKFDINEISYKARDVTFYHSIGYQPGEYVEGLFIGKFKPSKAWNHLRLNFDSDAHYETTTQTEDRKLIESIAIANLINIKKELNSDKNSFENLPDQIVSSIRPKLAVKMLSLFPDSKIELNGKVASGQKAIKLLEIASKAGELVEFTFLTTDLKNNMNLDSMTKEVSEVIRNMEK
jgi:hypothetical protein